MLKTSMMIRTILVPIAASLLTGVAPAAFAQSDEPDWVSSYNGNGRFSKSDWVEDIVQHDGNVYLTGWSFEGVKRAYSTVKLDSTGQQQWARQYQGATGGTAQANGIVVDESGNSYVTGFSSALGSIDVATIKYDQNGNTVWEHRYAGNDGNNHGLGIAIDDSGNTFVAGATRVGTTSDVLLIKLDSDGNLVWDQNIGVTGGNDAAYDLALDNQGNPVLAGYTNTSNIEALVAKFDGDSGNLLWERVTEGFSSHNIWEQVETDAAGNVFVSGEITPQGRPSNLTTAKYNNDGDLQWIQSYEGDGDGNNYASGLAVTADGEAVVVGTSGDAAPNSMVTIRYTANGSQRWLRAENGGFTVSIGQGVAVDDAGRVYAVGYGYNTSRVNDVISVAYEDNGDLLWSRVYGSSNGGADQAQAVAVDNESNVTVAARSYRGRQNGQDYVAIRYGK